MMWGVLFAYLIALGGMHCAAGAQSRVHYYRCMPQDCSEVDEPIEYV